MAGWQACVCVDVCVCVCEGERVGGREREGGDVMGRGVVCVCADSLSVCVSVWGGACERVRMCMWVRVCQGECVCVCAAVSVGGGV